MAGEDKLERHRQHYAALKRTWQPATAIYQARVAAYMRPDVRVLDLGCGRGGIVERLGRHGCWIGVDADLRSLVEHRLPWLPRGLAHAEALPFADDTFDIVATSWVLEHLRQPAVAFHEIARVLRPGGAFLCLTPNAAHPIPRLNIACRRLRRIQAAAVWLLYGRYPRDTFPVVYRANTPEAITRLAAAAGLYLREIILVEDPAYLMLCRLPLWLAALLEHLIPATWKIHLVGHFVKRARRSRGADIRQSQQE